MVAIPHLVTLLKVVSPTGTWRNKHLYVPTIAKEFAAPMAKQLYKISKWSLSWKLLSFQSLSVELVLNYRVYRHLTWIICTGNLKGNCASSTKLLNLVNLSECLACSLYKMLPSNSSYLLLELTDKANLWLTFYHHSYALPTYLP